MYPKQRLIIKLYYHIIYEKLTIINSRMVVALMPGSFNLVFLVLDRDTAAERIFNDLQGGGRTSEDAGSLEKLRNSIDRRLA